MYVIISDVKHVAFKLRFRLLRVHIGAVFWSPRRKILRFCVGSMLRIIYFLFRLRRLITLYLGLRRLLFVFV